MFAGLAVLIALTSAMAADVPRRYRIDTIAGADIGKQDDGGLARLSFLWEPSAMALGPHGEMYFTEAKGHRVRVIDPAGVIRTIAGTGEAGSDVDGRPGLETRLRSPNGVAVDSSGAVYIADTGNNTIRKIGLDGSSTTLHFREWRARSRTVGPDGLPDHLYWPSCLLVDTHGSVFIADTGNHLIRRIDSGGQAVVLSGTGKEGFRGDGGKALNAQLASPNGITLDRKGTLYIADSGNGRIRAVDSNGKIRTVAGGGSFDGDGRAATKTRFFNIERIAADEQGNLYVLEYDGKSYKSRVRRVDRDGIVCTLVGQATPVPGCPASIPFDGKPSDIAVDQSGTVYISDSRYEQIFRVEGSGKLVAVAGIGPGDGIPAILAHFVDVHEAFSLGGGPHISVDRAKNLYVSEGPRIRMIDAGRVVRTFAGSNAGSIGTEGDGGPAKSGLLGDARESR